MKRRRILRRLFDKGFRNLYNLVQGKHLDEYAVYFRKKGKHSSCVIKEISLKKEFYFMRKIRAQSLEDAREQMEYHNWHPTLHERSLVFKDKISSIGIQTGDAIKHLSSNTFYIVVNGDFIALPESK